MRYLCVGLIFNLASVIFFTSCGEDSEDASERILLAKTEKLFAKYKLPHAKDYQDLTWKTNDLSFGNRKRIVFEIETSANNETSIGQTLIKAALDFSLAHDVDVVRVELRNPLGIALPLKGFAVYAEDGKGWSGNEKWGRWDVEVDYKDFSLLDIQK
jgi:hypothetical protein